MWFLILFILPRGLGLCTPCSVDNMLKDPGDTVSKPDSCSAPVILPGGPDNAAQLHCSPLRWREAKASFHATPRTAAAIIPFATVCQSFHSRSFYISVMSTPPSRCWLLLETGLFLKTLSFFLYLLYNAPTCSFIFRNTGTITSSSWTPLQGSHCQREVEMRPHLTFQKDQKEYGRSEFWWMRTVEIWSS